jgi:hypothetical protein
MDSMRISRGLFFLAIVGAVALGYGVGQLRYFCPPLLSSGSVLRNSNHPSEESYYVVVPKVEALIDHKKVSANPTKAEWQIAGGPMPKEQCEAQLRERSEMGAGIGSDEGAPERHVQIDVTKLRRCVLVDVWDSVEKYSPDPKDVFRP